MPKKNSWVWLFSVFNWIDEIRPLCIKTSWSTVIPNLFMRGPSLAINWIPSFWSIHPIRLSMGFWSQWCVLLTLSRGSICQKKAKNFKKKLLYLASDQTSVRSNLPLIRLRLQLPLIRPPQSEVILDQTSSRPLSR